MPDAKSVGNRQHLATWLVEYLAAFNQLSHLITTPKLMILNIHSGLRISLDMILFNFICAYAK